MNFFVSSVFLSVIWIIGKIVKSFFGYKRWGDFVCGEFVLFEGYVFSKCLVKIVVFLVFIGWFCFGRLRGLVLG